MLRIVNVLMVAGWALALSSGSLSAHGGRTNSDGCHAGTRPYHCHSARARATPNRAIQDLNCEDFPTHQDAQSFYETTRPLDPHGLDRDRDGFACDCNPGGNLEICPSGRFTS